MLHYLNSHFPNVLIEILIGAVLTSLYKLIKDKFDEMNKQSKVSNSQINYLYQIERRRQQSKSSQSRLNPPS